MKLLTRFSVVSLLLSACGSRITPSISMPRSPTAPASTLSPTKTPFPSSTPIPVSYVYEDTISIEEKAEIERAVQSTYQYLAKLNLGSPGQLTVYAFSDIQKLTDISSPILGPEYHQSKEQMASNWQGAAGGSSAPGAVFLNTSYGPWNNGDPCFRTENIAHETWHVMQRQWIKMPLLGKDPMPLFGPEWLLEGSAQIFAFKVAAQSGPCDYERELRSRLEDSHPLSLTTMEGSSDMAQAGDAFWSLAPAAVDYLIKKSPKRLESLKDFYEEIGQGSSWDQAFQSVFGINPEQFYSEFALYITKP